MRRPCPLQPSIYHIPEMRLFVTLIWLHNATPHTFIRQALLFTRKFGDLRGESHICWMMVYARLVYYIRPRLFVFVYLVG